jgi:DNA-binding NarL/FixJ family response regulator
VLLVEDHPIYRDGLHSALDALEDIEVVGECSDAAGARQQMTRSWPDVVLLDLDLGRDDGVVLTAELTHAWPGIAVLVLTMDDAESSVYDALRAGARGYLLKGVDQAELARAIREVAAGEAVFGPGVARRMLAGLSGLSGSSVSSGSSGPGPRRQDGVLTNRERDTLELMAQGWGNPQIAEQLFVSPKTVRNNVSTILGKLHATSRGEAVVRARGWGYGQTPGARS